MESMLDLAEMMFEEAGDWVITLPLPKAWKVERPVQQLSNRVSATLFTSKYVLVLTWTVDHEIQSSLQDDTPGANRTSTTSSTSRSACPYH
jgi:hypothetical protein